MLQRLWRLVSPFLAALLVLIVWPVTTLAYSSASGFAVTDFATGFDSAQGLGPIGLAFDSANQLYVGHYQSGSISVFGPSGGSAGQAVRQLNTGLSTLAGLAFSKDGRLYAAVQSGSGRVVEINLSTGAVMRTVAGIPSATGLAVDPLSGDLFVTSITYQNIYRISSFSTGPGLASFYASVPADGIVFAPDGTLYANGYKIQGTNAASPGAVDAIPAAPSGDGIALAMSSDATRPPVLFINRLDGIITKLDLSTNVMTDIVTGGTRGDFVTVGPDGCLYATQTATVAKVTNSDGTCSFLPQSAAPQLSLALAAGTAQPASPGTPVTLTATLRNVSSPPGLPLAFSVAGANPQTATVPADASGQASFSYTGANGGQDRITVTTTVGQSQVVSNQIAVAWAAAPVAGNQSITVEAGTGAAIALQATDPAQKPLTYSVVSQPVHGTLTGTAPNVTYTPAQGYIGSDSFAFKANNGYLDSNTATVSINVQDTTKPTITGTATPAPNAAGWNNGQVKIQFTCADNGSGVASCTADAFLNQEGTNQSVTGTAVDIAGNKATATVGGINIDLTAPVTSISAPTTWQNKDVPVTFTATDNLAGVDATYYTVDGGAQQTGTSLTLSTEGVHTLTYWSVDRAGNAEGAHTATVKIDKSPPTITGATDRAANANGWYNADVTVTFTCADPLSAGVASGVASCSAPTTLSAEAANQSVTGNAADVAGNTASATVSSINIDKTAPVTTATPDRAANANGWYKANVTVTLAATDNLSGVAQTEYNLDGAGWTAYTTPVAISAERIHSLLYRSTDKAGNVEATNSLTIRIDKTPPEAYLQFDPVSHDIQLFGRDALSGLANPGPIAPVSVTPILGDDHGQQGGKKGDDRTDHRNDDRNDDRSTAETRTYLVKDLADNTLQLVVQVQKAGHDIKARVVSLQYNGGTVIAPLQDVLSWNWAVAKDGSLKVLQQQMRLVDGRTGSVVEAHYDALKNVTWIVRSQPGGRSDDNKNQKGHDDGEYPGAVKLPGMVLLRLASSQGHLVIEIPGLGQ